MITEYNVTQAVDVSDGKVELTIQKSILNESIFTELPVISWSQIAKFRQKHLASSTEFITVTIPSGYARKIIEKRTVRVETNDV